MRARVCLSALFLFAAAFGLLGCDGCTPPLIGGDAGGDGDGGLPSCDDDGDCVGGRVCRQRACVLADAGASDDAGAFDAGLDDAGTPDAGLDDAGAFDAGLDDAGAFDAGPDDAGLDDAGASDAGTSDAGPCRSSRECPSDLVCADLRDEGAQVTPYCNAPSRDPNDADLAEACAEGSDCDTGLCLPRAEVCSVACEDTALDCPAGATCTAYPFGLSSTWIGVCADACADDSGCAAPRVCTYNGNPLTNAFDAICEVPAGAGDLGAACATSEDCISGLCVPEGCSRVCDGDEDCAGGAPGNALSTCRQTTVATPLEDGTTTLLMCRQ